MPLLKNGFLEKIETWHAGLFCQYTHLSYMSFSSKSEHDTVADQATLKLCRLYMLFVFHAVGGSYKMTNFHEKE